MPGQKPQHLQNAEAKFECWNSCNSFFLGKFFGEIFVQKVA